MKTPEEIAEIYAGFPDVTPELMDECNLRFVPYIFYEDVNGERQCTCTVCQKKWSYPQRIVDEADALIIKGKHNYLVRCPHCSASAYLKNMGRAKKRKSLTEMVKAVFVIPASFERVYIRCFFVWKYYTNRINPPDFRMSETARYYIETGTALCWKDSYCYTELGIENYFKLRSNILQPFSDGGMFGYEGCTEYVGVGEVDNTFLKYSQWDSKVAEHCDPLKWWCTYAKYPQIEMLVKNGYTDLAQTIYCGRKGRGLINWKASKPHEFFKLTPQEMKQYSQTDKTLSILGTYKKLKKLAPLTFADAEDFYRKTNDWDIDPMIKIMKEYKLTLTKVRNYLAKKHGIKENREKTTTYIDYIRMAEKLEYDLKNEVVLYPKKLKKAHDDAVRNYNAIRTEIETKNMEKLTRKLEEKYAFSGDEFSVVVPQSMQEIIYEGKTLKHCVGSYAERHASGATVILFLRSNTSLDTPMYTIEMYDTRMRQVQGNRNKRPLAPEAEEFFGIWIKWVQDGSKRNKHGSPVIDSGAETDTYTPALAVGA